MIRVIMAHSDYDPEQREGAVAEIISLIFEMFPEFLNMEGQIANINIPYGGQNSGKAGTNSTKGKKKAKKDGDEDEDEDAGEPPSSDQETDESLRMEALDAQKLLNSGTKLTSVKLNNLYEPWSRQSSIPMGVGTKAFRGQNLITFHTHEWSVVTGGAWAHRLRILACSAIMEQTIISMYRIGLLDYINGGAAAIRLAIEDNTERYRVPCPLSRKKQKLKSQVLGATDQAVQLVSGHMNLTWPDQIVAAVLQIDFKLEVELESQACNSLLVHQTCQAQKIIDLVQNSRIAWVDTTSTVEAREHPPFMVKFRKHYKYSLRAAEGEGFASRILKNKKFLVPSEEDEIILLEAEARTRQKHQDCAEEHDENEEPSMLNAKKGQDSNGARGAPSQSEAESQSGAVDLCVHPTCPSSSTQPSVQHEACIDFTGSVDSPLDADSTLDNDPTLASDLTLDSDPIPSSPILNANHVLPYPAQGLTSDVSIRSNTDLNASEDSVLTAEDDGIGSAAKSDDELGSNLLASNDVSYKEPGKAILRPRPILCRGKNTGRGTEGHRPTKEVASTSKKHQASHSVSSSDSYGNTANGKHDKKRRQLNECDAGLSGNAVSQPYEDNDTIFSQLA
ncbi:hypothetical protein BDR07DRAFT_1386325 [Suillus spraguei]|nr:hypothetical protein BDR07DRAFT_1386325 [Suillus spraguei]